MMNTDTKMVPPRDSERPKLPCLPDHIPANLRNMHELRAIQAQQQSGG